MVVRVGQVGTKGVFELQDLFFTSKGQTPGAVFIEWNAQGRDGEPGSAGMWGEDFSSLSYATPRFH